MITLELVSLSGMKLSEDVHEVLLPTPDGQIAIFPSHSQLVSLADNGIISVRRNPNDADDAMEHYACNGGVVEITKNRIRVLVDEAENSDEINEAEAAEALERAKNMARDAKDQVSLDHAQTMISTQQNRLRVAGLKNRRRRQA